jgi:hypothetical protein
MYGKNMKQEVARQIKTRSLRAIAELDAIVADIRGQCPDEEFEFIKRGVGMSIIKINSDLLEPIYKQHPGIDPLRSE